MKSSAGNFNEVVKSKRVGGRHVVGHCDIANHVTWEMSVGSLQRTSREISRTRSPHCKPSDPITCLSLATHPPLKSSRLQNTTLVKGGSECLWCQWGGRPIRRALYLKANGNGVQKWYLDEFKVHLSSEKHQRRLPCPELLPLGDCDPRGSLACRDNVVRVPTRPFAAQAAQILSFCLLNRAGQFDTTWRRCGGSFSRQKVGLPARSACDQEQGQSVHDSPPHPTQTGALACHR